MVSDRDKEKLAHLHTVCKQLDENECCAFVIGVEFTTLDEQCCDMHRLLIIQEMCSIISIQMMNMYMKRRRNASRN